MDPVANYLTRIRNAVSAKHRIVEMPSSKIKKEITKVLYEKGYIRAYKFENEKTIRATIKIALKYHLRTNQPAIVKIERISKPGLRRYCNAKSLPRVINGLGIAIISTSKGIMTDKEARNLNIGGEVLCFVY